MAEADDDVTTMLPDPYGHGFVRAENPVERTMEKWRQQEHLRMRFGLLARHRFMLTVRLLFGASIAIVALVSVIVPAWAPANPGYVVLFWSLPFLLGTVPPLLAGES
ncbi:MAG: hypothetical protein ACPHHS_08340, partial [Candidatus Poseidoniaceae archaeon]